MDSITFRKAEEKDEPRIWEILQQAIERRRSDGSEQWQNGYPNPKSISEDIQNQVGYVIINDNEIQAYAAVILNNEPAYDSIKGKWLRDGDFYVIHRVAVSDKVLGKGYAKIMFVNVEQLARKNGIKNLKVDTNFDNPAMLHIFEKLGYVYCGEVILKGGERKAYQKILD